MSKLHLVMGGLLAAAMSLPAMAASVAPEKSEAAEAPKAVERIEVTARVDPSFAFSGAEGGWEVVQHTYDRVEGRFADVDNLSHPNYAIAQVALEDMVQRYPGA